MALINEYGPGVHRLASRRTPIRYRRRDLALVGLSNEVSAVLRPFGADVPRRSATHDIVLHRRSAHLITGGSRQAYDHHIPPVAQLRYSVTFRTLR
jgi:alkylated DNA repair dioxygenase AlkB